MKRKFFAYALIFAASAAVGYVSVKPASAATTVSVSVHAQPVHYGYRPPARYYVPPPGYYYPRSYFVPRYYHGSRNPTAYWRWGNSWDHRDRRNWNEHHDRRDHDRNDRHDRHDNDHHDRDRDRDRDRGHWNR